ncbi:MAG: hypothetical protein H0W85_02665 [Methylotenera sp.]|nr:hypothetical protein [Methylotenera sp.]
MKPIQVDFKPSVIFMGLLILATLAACMAIILMPIAWQIKLLVLLVVVVFSSYTILYHGLLRMPGSIVSLSVNVKNELHLLRKDGKQLLVDVASNTTVTPYLVVLNYHHKSSSKLAFNSSIIVMPDNADSESMRAMRVWLRWGKVAI